MIIRAGYILPVLLFFAVAPHNLYAQTWETGIIPGASNYVGELAPRMVPEETNFAAGFYVKRNLSDFFSLSANIHYGRISGNDENFDHLASRGLNFRTDIYEFSAIVEYNFFPFMMSFRSQRNTPYIFTGLSFFLFEPRGYDGNQWVNLRPLRTEGQGLNDGPDQYNPFSFAIPVGLGYKTVVSDKWILGFQAGFRASFTDYLDDVSGYYYDQEILRDRFGENSAYFSNPSQEDDTRGMHGKQRGEPHRIDWYIFTGVVISYRISDPVCYRF